MPRFYLPENLSVGQTVALPDNIVRHLNVLRVRPNENITLFDGKGKAHAAQLTVLEKRRAEAEILHEDTTDNESPLNITLIQSISSGDRMDFTLQKKRRTRRNRHTARHQRTLHRPPRRRTRRQTPRTLAGNRHLRVRTKRQEHRSPRTAHHRLP